MASIVLAVALFWLQASGILRMSASAQSYRSDCDPAFKAISAQHTMCLPAGPGTPVSVDSNGVTQAHNAKRQLQSDATDLVRLYWDPDVARVAERWATQCNRYGPHDKQRGVPSLPGIYIGQNVATGYRTFQAAIDGWYSEIDYFRFGQGSTNGQAVGHYTQMVSKDVYRIGCGQALCPGNTPVYVCNYVTGWHNNSPYTQGQQCAACPNSCTAGQCDCKGLVCLNSGFMDKNSCTCRCQPNVQGNNCGTVACPQSVTDWRCRAMRSSSCEAKWSGTEDYIKYLCPELCGLCTAGQTQTAPGGGAVSGSSPSGSNQGVGTGSGGSSQSSGGTASQGTSGTGGQTSGGASPTPSSGGSASQGTGGSSGGASNQGSTNSQTPSGSGSCEDNWACGYVTASKCLPRSYINGKLILDLCPKLCGKCGSASGQTSTGTGAGNSNPSSSSGSASSGSTNSGDCTDNWACEFTTASQCKPLSYLNGKLVTELCPRLCNLCSSTASRSDSAAAACKDSWVCSAVTPNMCQPGSTVAQLCPKTCNQC